MIAALVFITFAHASEPKCPEIPAQTWKANQEACYKGFSKNPPDKVSAKQLCSCVADSIVDKMSCAEIKRYTTDKKFADVTRKRIAKLCISDSSSHTRAAIQEDTTR